MPMTPAIKLSKEPISTPKDLAKDMRSLEIDKKDKKSSNLKPIDTKDAKIRPSLLATSPIAPRTPTISANLNVLISKEKRPSNGLAKHIPTLEIHQKDTKEKKNTSNVPNLKPIDSELKSPNLKSSHVGIPIVLPLIRKIIIIFSKESDYQEV
jgi:hypothetical protein